MNWSDFEGALSAPRVGRYRARCNGSEALAIEAYRHNLLVAEALTPFLCTVEVVLRNAIHSQLVRHYGRRDWWEAWDRTNPLFTDLRKKIAKAKNELHRRKEPQTPDKVVAELTFGFWCTLFNAKFQKELWQPLAKAFPHCPKPSRQRSTISSVVNKLRDLRNRAFHHEPVLWMPTDTRATHDEGMELLTWMHGPLATWFAGINRVPNVWQAWKAHEATMVAQVPQR